MTGSLPEFFCLIAVVRILFYWTKNGKLVTIKEADLSASA